MQQLLKHVQAIVMVPNYRALDTIYLGTPDSRTLLLSLQKPSQQSK